MFKFGILIFALSVMFGCTGNRKSPDNPQPKTYGVFRTLKPKTVIAPAIIGATSTNVSTTMHARAYHRAIQMLNGKVLICGGDVDNPNIPTMDIFDPATETFTYSNAHPNIVRRYQIGSGVSYQSFAMVNLPNGEVAIIGAQDDSQSAISGQTIYEIYDPVADTLVDNTYKNSETVNAVDAAYYIGNDQIMIFETSTRQLILNWKTGDLTQVTNDSLSGIGKVAGASTIQDVNGDIYFVGGYLINANHASPAGTPITNISKYEVAAGKWISCAPMTVARSYASLVLIANNRVGIYGGQDINNTPITSVEIYNIAYNTVSQSLDLVGTRAKAAACYLQTGYTLISGGIDSTHTPQKSQLSHNVSQLFSGSTGDMTTPRVGLTTTPLANGLVLLTGGEGSLTSFTTGEIFDPQAAIYMNYISEQMSLGTTMQFSAKDATGASVTPIWTVDDTSIATINNTGLLIPVKSGVITVTATSGNNTAVARIRILPN